MGDTGRTQAAQRFFADRQVGDQGLALFLNAGDPPLAVLRDVVQALDELGVDCLELAVPFPHSFTDGPVVRRSAMRALDVGVGLPEVLQFLGDVRSGLRRLRIALLADWGHTVKPDPIGEFVARVSDSAADGVLLHGLPPRLRARYYAAAADRALPVVTTCYPSSTGEVRLESAAHASAYLYLVAHYGRSGSRPQGGFDALGATIHGLRAHTRAPIAVGFGVRSRADLQALAGIGADAAVIGSAAVECVERAVTGNGDPISELAGFVRALRAAARPAGHEHVPFRAQHVFEHDQVESK
ncbi:MAG: tryptophan synthase subunit alpha [Actinomycetota bacterium]|nr:tryptophan synthase subunit alpha [Actinomycetota bacterium]